VRLWCHGSAAAISNGGFTQQKIGTHSRRAQQLVQPDSKQEEWQPQYIGVYTAHLSSHLPLNPISGEAQVKNKTTPQNTAAKWIVNVDAMPRASRHWL